MPELANPWASPGTSLNEQRNSKSPTVPLVQIRKVFPLAGFSGGLTLNDAVLDRPELRIAVPAGQVLAVEEPGEAWLRRSFVEQSGLRPRQWIARRCAGIPAGIAPNKAAPKARVSEDFCVHA